MAYRNPADVKEEFRAHPRRALIMTTVLHESRAVKAHLTNPEMLIGEKHGLYEYGRFSDPAGDWLVVHAFTQQGNSDAALVASKAHQEFGSFDATMFVGVAGSLKEDIPIGSVVVGDYVYNAHSAKVEDAETSARPHGLVPARELLKAAEGLIYMEEWKSLICSPAGMELPKTSEYPCEYPPLAVIKGIASGEEVLAGGKSQRYTWLRSHFNNCGAVEMEGWGVMNAAHHENAAAIIVRGISDMCAGKDHAKDRLHQPIAAAHAAAFAFSILSFRSRVPGPGAVSSQQVADNPVPKQTVEASPAQERRIEFVFNFEGSKDDWSQEKVDGVVAQLKRAINDDKLTLVRIDVGSVRLVMSVRETDLAGLDLAKLRDAARASGVTLLGATPLEAVREADQAKKTLAAASADLLTWEKTLPNGVWIDRPERETVEARFQFDTSSTVLLGEPGSGKSALLSRIATDLLEQGATIFALKSDFLSPDVGTEADLQRDLDLPAAPSELILRLAALQPIYVFIDQLDALASQLDLRSGRLNVLLNLVRRIGGVPNVHLLLSARTFEFNHDVRLRAVEAEAVTLALPPWHEVKGRLAEISIDGDTWPEKARDVIRIPQALKTFLALAGSGRTEPFTTYQAMLEQLWRDRIASADDSESLVALASALAGQMAEEEALWLAASRFDDRLNSLKRLEALGFIVRSENSLSVAFSHQMVFDYVLARTFVRKAGLLSTYVLERQDSLFVRAKIWSALNYLRGAEAKSYEREFLGIWKTNGLRRHLRLLLIEFLGQVGRPLEFERTCMAEVLNLPAMRIFGLKAMGSSSGWFEHFAPTAVRDAMAGTDAEVSQAIRILATNWKTDSDRVIRLINERWVPDPGKDGYSWMVIHDCPLWTDQVEEIASTILKRTSISVWQVDHTAMTVAVEQPGVAMRLIRDKLGFLLAEARKAPEPPPVPADASDEEKIVWYMRHNWTRSFEHLLHAQEWTDLPSLAGAAPAEFLQFVWPWYVSVLEELLARSDIRDVKHVYPGQYVAELELTPSPTRSAARDKPVISAVQVAVEELAEKAPDQFVKWADENSHLDILAVQQLLAHGFEFGASHLASKALDWLLLDQRRFQLGNRHGHRHTTVDLVCASASQWTKEEIERFEKAVLAYRPPVPDHLTEPKDRKVFADLVRATKKDLLQALGSDRLTPKNRDLVVAEQRALGDRFDRSVGEVEGGFIGSPMDAGAMAKAKDRDILRIFREIPDNTNWGHPKHWMKGGNIQLSRAFSEFARTDPERAMRLMEQFEPHQQERAASYALDAMADDAPNDDRVIEAFLDLAARGFQAAEFRDSAARAIEKISNRKGNISDDVIAILIGWLDLTSPTQVNGSEEDVELTSRSGDEDVIEGSILWGSGGFSVLPGGNFTILSALASILLNMKELGRDRYIGILNDHLPRERNPNVWKALLYRLSNAGGSTSQGVSAFLREVFVRFPQLMATREAVTFFASAQRWDDQLVFDLIRGWQGSDKAFLQRAYGELAGLIGTVTEKANWAQSREEIIAAGPEEAKIGLAYAAVNLWNEAHLKQRSTDMLVALLNGASKELVAAVMDIFRVTDDLAPDAATAALLHALAEPQTDMSKAPSHFVVERLQGLLPHEAERVAAIADKLINAWRPELNDMRTGTVTAAPQLTDLALTLHRMGGASRRSGIAIFEAMIEIDAYGARETLAEIDGRFGAQQVVARRRLARRQRPARPRRQPA